MNPVALELLERIDRDGRIDGDLIKVDRFLNHMVDPLLLAKLGKELYRRFAHCKVDKIITAESSGIVIAHTLALCFGVPFVFAKKKPPKTMGEYYSASSYSFTKQESTKLFVAKEVLPPQQHLLFADDFYAFGSTYQAIQQIIDQAGAYLVGAAVIINKSDRSDIEAILTMENLSSSE